MYQTSKPILWLISSYESFQPYKPNYKFNNFQNVSNPKKINNEKKQIKRTITLEFKTTTY